MSTGTRSVIWSCCCAATSGPKFRSKFVSRAWSGWNWTRGSSAASLSRRSPAMAISTAGLPCLCCCCSWLVLVSGLVSSHAARSLRGVSGGRAMTLCSIEYCSGRARLTRCMASVAVQPKSVRQNSGCRYYVAMRGKSALRRGFRRLRARGRRPVSVVGREDSVFKRPPDRLIRPPARLV